MIDSFMKSFKILNNSTNDFEEGQFCHPDKNLTTIKHIFKSISMSYVRFHLILGKSPPKWRQKACIAYWNEKLFYIGGLDMKLKPVADVNVIDQVYRYQTLYALSQIFANGEWHDGPSLPLQISNGIATVCNQKLYGISSTIDSESLSSYLQ